MSPVGVQFEKGSNVCCNWIFKNWIFKNRKPILAVKFCDIESIETLICALSTKENYFSMMCRFTGFQLRNNNWSVSQNRTIVKNNNFLLSQNNLIQQIQGN